MELKVVINKRRAYRSLDKIEINEEIVKDLAQSAQLAPSCFNKQPWRYVFVYEKKVLEKLYGALSTGNEWAHSSSMIVAVLSKKEMDCILKEREYFLFDTGMATAFLILRATELGLVAHPIAGYDEEKAKEILEIPDDMKVITLVIIGKKSDKINSNLSEMQKKMENNRPERISLEKFVFHNKY